MISSYRPYWPSNLPHPAGIQRSKISVSAQVELHQQLRLGYPQAQTIYVVMDNWPMPYHPDLLATLVS